MNPLLYVSKNIKAIVLFALANLFVLPPPALPAITDADWAAMNRGDIYGANGPVYAQVWYKGVLYVGGAFTFVGNIQANHIARWDGSSWDSLGSGADSTVMALSFDSSGHLYAGGKFFHAGKLPVNQIARWDGITWGALGTGPHTILGHYRDYASWVSAIVADVRGNIFVGGEFTAIDSLVVNNIAKWDGTKWSPLGIGIQASRCVNALALDRNMNLFAGGDFDSAGNTNAHYIAKWDGTTWDSLGPGVSNNQSGATVHCIISDGNGSIYAGGMFARAGDSIAANIAKWDGGKWSAMGIGLWMAPGYAKVFSLAIDHEGHVFAGGQFNKAGMDTSFNFIAMYDEDAWVALRKGINKKHSFNDGVFSLATDDKGCLFVGGGFGIADGKKANNVAQWNGIEWNILGKGFEGPVNDTVYAVLSDRKGGLYAGGSFKGGVAHWKNGTWDTLGNGVNGCVRALCMDSSGIVYAAGLFDSAGTRRAKNIAKWNGYEWVGLDLGISPGPVNALVCDSRGNVFAGGEMTVAGRDSADLIAQWDGYSWSPLGAKIAISPEVYSLEFDGKGSLYAVGNFSFYRLSCFPNFAKFDGTNWDSTFNPFTRMPFSNETYTTSSIVFDGDGDPYFTVESLRSVIIKSEIYRFKNNTLQSIGAMNTHVASMCFDVRGNLYVTGKFDSVTTADFKRSRVNGIVKWNGSEWETLGSGLSLFGNTLEVEDSTLYIGGLFYSAGNNFSPYVAKVNVHDIQAGTQRIPHPRLYSPEYRYTHHTLYISNIGRHDAVFLYSLSGKVLYRTIGASRITLNNIPQQPVVIRIIRKDTTIASGIFLVLE